MKINVELKNVNYIKHNNFEEIEITENGEYTANEDYDAIGKAVVNVEPKLEEIEITENGEYTPSEGKDGFSKVEVLVQPDTQEIEITENGEYTPSQGYIGFSKVDVNVETYEPPLNLVLTNPTDGSSINLPITFQWNIDNLEQGETPVYYLFVDDNLVYKGNNTSFMMKNMPISGKVHTCHVIANSETRSGFTDIINFNLPYEFLYGFDIDESIEDPEISVTYTDDCVEFIPAGLDNNDEFQYGDWKTFVDRICRPVMLRSDGTVDYELDHDNQLYKLDGTICNDIQDVSYDGNAMVEFKKIYMKLWKDNNIVKCRFSDVKLDSDYKAYPFINENGIEQDFMYLSMFPSRFRQNVEIRKCKSYYLNNTIGSASGGWTENCTNIYNYIRNNGNGYTSLSISAYTFLQMLCTLISKSRYTKKSFGYGIYSLNYYTGIFIDKPCFYGKFNNAISNLNGNKMFYMENIYSGFKTLIDGIIIDNDILYYKTVPPYLLNKDDSYKLIMLSNINSNNLKEIKCEDNIILPYQTNNVNDYNKNYCSSAYFTTNYKYMGNQNVTTYKERTGIFSFYSIGASESVSGRIMFVKPTQNNS